MRSYVRCRRVARAAVAAIVVIVSGAVRADGQSVRELQQELKAMKTQLQQLQEKMEKQEELIEKLSKQGGPASAPTAAAVAAPATPSPEQEQLERRVTTNVLEKIQPSLSAANKTFPAQFNPAIGLIIDTVGSYQENGGGNFEFRSAEIGISANIDPFARGYAIFNGTNDGVDVEEAAIVTTSLPYNLAVKGGRFFADFGRLSKFHDHDLPFVNRPQVLDTFVGGESQADGVEVSYLAPLEQYLTLTLGAYNKIGADNEQVNNNVPRTLNRFTYLAHPATFINVNDSNSIDLGANLAYTPKVDTFATDDMEAGNGKARYLADLDITFRYVPLSQAQYRGLIWGTEVLYNSEDWNVSDETTPVFRSEGAFGLYSYLEARLTRRYYPGFMFDYQQALDRQQGDLASYSPYFTIWLSEFQRLRLQYTYLTEPANHESQFFLQWTGVLGSHVHGFRDR
jgi:cell division protein FtsB